LKQYAPKSHKPNHAEKGGKKMIYIIQYPKNSGGAYVLAAAAQDAETAIQCAIECAKTDLKLYGYTFGYIVADETQTFARVVDSLENLPRIIRYEETERTTAAIKRAIIAQSGFFGVVTQ
jgi:hypothetical protein